MSMIAGSPKDFDDFESLLHISENRRNNIVKAMMGLPQKGILSKKAPTKADKNASLEDMIEMLSAIVSKCLRKDNVQFQPDEGARLSVDQGTKIEHPYICYEVISRVPDRELKPREREEFDEETSDENSRRAGRTYGQRFNCLIQFNIIAADYKSANKTMQDFEELIFNYTSYLKQNGVAEIIFERQFTDNNLDMYRQDLSIRSLQYRVFIERLYTIYASEIENIMIE